jgi:hypothetical protein
MLVLGDQEYTLSVRASEAANILLKEEGAANGGGSK